jgi:phosphoribosyl-dephospho-CoA transferase
MQPIRIDNPQVHDLVLVVDSQSVLGDCAGQPSWVNQALASCPWVVVRRVPAPEDQIAIGVRGTDRNERWSGFLHKALIERIIRPPELLALARYQRIFAECLPSVRWRSSWKSGETSLWPGGPQGVSALKWPPDAM